MIFTRYRQLVCGGDGRYNPRRVCADRPSKTVLGYVLKYVEKKPLVVDRRVQFPIYFDLR